MIKKIFKKMLMLVIFRDYSFKIDEKVMIYVGRLVGYLVYKVVLF